MRRERKAFGKKEDVHEKKVSEGKDGGKGGK